MSDWKDLIWITRDNLMDQVSGSEYNDIIFNPVMYEEKIEGDIHWWFAFEPGTIVHGNSIRIEDLENARAFIPAELSDEHPEPEEPEEPNNNNQTNSGYSTYAFFVAAAPTIWEVIRTSRAKNWDKKALTSRIKKIDGNVQVLKIENLPTGLFTAPQKQANVWAKLPDMEISKLTNQLIEAINHKGIQKPTIGELKKVSSTDEKPSTEGIGTTESGIPWNTIKWVGISGLGLYGLNILFEQTNFKSNNGDFYG